MNCQQIRNRILALPKPGTLPKPLAAHVQDCLLCQAWRRHFAAVDAALPRLPVPVSDGRAKAALLEKIRGAATPRPLKKPDTPILELPAIDRTLPGNFVAKSAPLNLADELPRRKLSLGHTAARLWPAGLIAATVLIGTIAWLSLRGNRPAPVNSMPADPLLDSLVRLNVELAATQTPAERVKVLARVADELNQEMREIARADATGENMQDLEKMYRDVVLKGMLEQARLVERRQREAILSQVADGLSQAGKRAQDTAEQAPEHSAAALRDAAGTAREGTKELHRLIREALS